MFNPAFSQGHLETLVPGIVEETLVLVTKLNEAAEKNESLKQQIETHLAKGAMVVAMAGGGGGSLDEWLRQQFS